MYKAPTSKRKFATKGRTGCSTCKSRHIRCDERKPRCTPCQKSSRQCEYSAHPVRPYPDQLRIVIWSPNGLDVRRVSPNPGHASDERRGFDFFRTNVAVNLGGFFESSFWTQDVLQAAQHEASIYHAVVALASLSENVLRKKSEHERDNQNEKHDDSGKQRSPFSSRSCEQFAVQQRAKAICILNQKMQDGKKSSPDIILVTCALFIYSEMLMNNHESALRQMSTGVFVYCDWYSKQGREAGTAAPRLTRLAHQLQQIFRRLLLQIILFIDTKPQEWQFIDPSFTPAIPSIPSVFVSIDEARHFLDNYLCSVYHGILTSQMQSLKDWQIPGLSNQDVLPLMTSTSSSEAAQVSDNPLYKWELAFATFLADQKPRFSPKEQQAAMLLKVQHITGSILASAGVFSPETTFDSFEESFSKIVSFASYIIDSRDESLQDLGPICPAFDMGLLPHLYFAASRCRHPLIRRQALHLLRIGPHQEGIWHSVMLSNIAEHIMNLEEANCADIRSSADVPATARISVLNATINSTDRIVALHCCRPRSGNAETVHVLHETVSY